VLALACLTAPGLTAPGLAESSPITTSTTRIPGALGLVTPQPGSAATVEPRIISGRAGTLWAISNNAAGDAAVYGSDDGGRSWRTTPTVPAGQVQPTVDTDLTLTTTGRLVAVELDGAALAFQVSYSDDHGKSWHRSLGTFPTDDDRPWLASGPKGRVYVAFHNLASGAFAHDMWVQTSTDDGRSFGPPVPLALPGQQSWLDLQCADSSGPSGIAVDQGTGRIVVSWATRTSAAGGCGADLAPGSLQASVVFATRIWVATSATAAFGSWIVSLAVDRSRTGDIVDTQFAAPVIDAGHRVYIVYEQTRGPADLVAGVRIVSADPLHRWSAARVLDPPAGQGDVLATAAAGRRGRIAVFWLHGSAAAGQPASAALWRPAGVLLTGNRSVPLSLPAWAAYRGSAAAVDGLCGSGPGGNTDTDWLLCPRAADDFGAAATADHRAAFSWVVGLPGHTDGTYVTVTAPVL